MPPKIKFVTIKAKNSQDAMDQARARYPKYVPVRTIKERVAYRPYRIKLRLRKK